MAEHNSPRHLLNLQVLYRHHSVAVQTLWCWLEVLFFVIEGGENVAENEHLQLQQTQLAGAGQGFSAALRL